MPASKHPQEHPPRQPLLHAETVLLRAPTQVWSALDGSMDSAGVHGVYFSDVRLVRSLGVEIGGAPGEHVGTAPSGSDSATFVSVARGFDDPLPDPYVRVEHTRQVTATGVDERVLIRSHRDEPIDTEIVVRLTADLTALDLIKQGLAASGSVEVRRDGGLRWGDAAISARLTAPGAEIGGDGTDIHLRWTVTVPARDTVSVGFELVAEDTLAVVRPAAGGVPWSIPTVHGDDRLARWVGAALADLDALRMTTARDPDHVFVAAGAPWFFTLFGRDSLWTARFLLPLGTGLAHDTLRILAGLQGTENAPDRAEEPGKIMHELRRGELSVDGDVYLPPLYYGTVDATALWINVLYDAWKWGLPDADVAALMPNVEGALTWIRDYADADGDGLLEYIDRSGHGLANQGWKDSGDSVQWRDGTLAKGPIALCEVQAYAYQAAIGGAELIEHFGGDGDPWRQWAGRLKKRFHETFWVDSPDGAYPAIALDARKRPVDTLTSNIGHLLGTGLLDDRQSALVARRLVSPELDSGYGLRTMSTDASGYWPLSYHGGSVWTHDTAIAIAGLARAGFRKEASSLIEGLLAAASAFSYRMPELHSGDAASGMSRPMPYPAACRPQAWSAAAAISVLGSVLGLEPDAGEGVLGASPASSVALSISGLRFAGADVAIAVNATGEVTGATGATVEVR